jgi:hypothetical protein
MDMTSAIRARIDLVQSLRSFKVTRHTWESYN